MVVKVCIINNIYNNFDIAHPMDFVRGNKLYKCGRKEDYNEPTPCNWSGYYIEKVIIREKSQAAAIDGSCLTVSWSGKRGSNPRPSAWEAF